MTVNPHKPSHHRTFILYKEHKTIIKIKNKIEQKVSKNRLSTTKRRLKNQT